MYDKSTEGGRREAPKDNPWWEGGTERIETRVCGPTSSTPCHSNSQLKPNVKNKQGLAERGACNTLWVLILSPNI